MVGSLGYTDQITRLDGDGEHGGRFRVDVKYAGTLDGESNFVLSMQMFFVEFGQHLIQSRSFPVDVDYISGHETMGVFETLNLG